MKITTTTVALAVAMTGTAHAQGSGAADIPNLVGTWLGSSQGADATGFFSTGGHVPMVIEEQQGRGLKASIEYPGGNGAKAEFSGAIGADGASLYFAEEDGMMIGTLTDQDTMELCYIEIGEDRKVTCGTKKRQAN